MTQPPHHPPQPPSSPPPARRSSSLTLLLLLGVSAAVVFWAGLSLGGQHLGSSADERAAIEAFSRTYRSITQLYIGSPAPEELLEGAIDGMFEVLEDPYSRYMGADEFDTALDDVRGEFEGIGAIMATRDTAGADCTIIGESCRLQVLEVMADAPADQAGLLAGDVVTAVDGEPLADSTIEDAVRRIRGPRGSEVSLALLREGSALELVVRRDRVISRDVRPAVLADGSIGYLAIDVFSQSAADHLEEALRTHLEAGRSRLILDIRDDPGGFVEAAVEISSQFLSDGAVFWEEDANGRQTAIEVVDGGLAVDPDVELVVLVNGGTASASEILAGALQDAGRARLVGERTFGKGSVQEWMELAGDTGGFRLSVARWLTRDKRPIDGRGLLPDILVPGGGQRFRPGIPSADPALDDQLRVAIELLSAAPTSSPAVAEIPALAGN